MKIESINLKTGFLYCPRCGLRKPISEILDYYSGFCPTCGYRMIEELYLPYTPKKSRLSDLIPSNKYMSFFSNYFDNEKSFPKINI
jgi:hypothetical protein